MLKKLLLLVMFISMQVQVEASKHADKTPPQVSISSPANGAKLQYLKPLYGKVRDKGAGVARVVVSIRRLSIRRLNKSQTFYWNGYKWSLSPAKTALEFWYLADLSGNKWKFNYVPRRSGSVDGHGTPQEAPALVSGVYIFRVTAYDRAGNKRSVDRSVIVNADATRPKIRFTYPKNHAVLKDFASVRGVAQDIMGSGVAGVFCRITRQNDYGQWDGQVWNHAYFGDVDVWMPEPMAFSKGQWRLSGHLPQGANLKRGLYIIEIVAIDRAGNDSSQVIRSRPDNRGYFFQTFPTTLAVTIR